MVLPNAAPVIPPQCPGNRLPARQPKTKHACQTTGVPCLSTKTLKQAHLYLNFETDQQIMSQLDMMLLQECGRRIKKLFRVRRVSCPDTPALEKVYSAQQTTENATVLFIDIKGYTAICNRHTPDDIGKWIANFFNCIRHIASVMAVDIVETRGDCCICKLHIGKHAERMLIFARMLYMALLDVMTPSGFECTGVRMGMASGDVVVLEMGATRSLQGHAVNMAERMEAASGVGCVCVHASSLRELRMVVEDDIEFVQCKGICESQKASDMACVTGLFRRPSSSSSPEEFCFEI
jgi:class 3 adenylate cyclase